MVIGEWRCVADESGADGSGAERSGAAGLVPLRLGA